MNIKRSVWLSVLATTLLFTACKDACEDFTCEANKEAIEDVITGICLCICSDGFVGENCDQTQNDFDIDLIKSYLLDNEIEAESLDNGLHYVITESLGATPGPQLSDVVDVTYSGYLLNGTVFDSGSLEFALSSVIEGWQIGIPFFAKGDKGTLFIPSALAYGTNPPPGTVIPANAVLLFDIELHDY